MSGTLCGKVGCGKPGNHRGYCLNHYKQAITSREIAPLYQRNAPILEKLERYSKPNPSTGCMEWTGYRNQDGYGQVNTGKRMVGAHRAVWQAEYGSIPNGINVLHHCDNPCCINLGHLFLGTQADNVADMISKKRNSPNIGVANGRVKLSEDQVRKIRKDARLQKEIAAEYGVNQTLVSMIKRRSAWSHVV